MNAVAEKWSALSHSLLLKGYYPKDMPYMSDRQGFHLWDPRILVE